MKKSAVARILANLASFKKNGSYYVGTCNENVITGYGLDAPPSAIYITRFALPCYDDIEFLHFGLGERILTLPMGDDAVSESELAEFLRRDWSLFSAVNDCKSLIEYIDLEGFVGTYALWVRYLTHIRCGEFEAASRFVEGTEVARKFSEAQTIPTLFAQLSEAKSRGGWEACQALLDEWQRKTKATYCCS